MNERVLMTVLFTDIVGSSERVAASGDRRWCHQLNAHDELVEALLAKYGGRRAKHTGTASSRISTDQPRQLVVLWIWSPRLPPAASASVPECTPANASDAATSGAV